MVSSSARWKIACTILILGVASYASAQSAPPKPGTATVSGKVTLKGKGVSGILVVARDPNIGGPSRSRYRGTADETGNYRISLPAGSYQIVPLTQGLVMESQLNNSMVVVNDGETVEDFNFALVRGGVITGKVTDADGKPLIEELVSIQGTGGGNTVYSSSGNQTDDRGVYRIYGLSPGKYKVSVGQSGRFYAGDPRRAYRETFYPSVMDETKATVVEVTEGSEASDINIVVGRQLRGFRVTGRIVDAETEKPLPNIMYGITYISEHGRTSTSGQNTNARGEFRFESLVPGKYMVFVESHGTNNIRADSVSFEVTDHDINDLVLKASRGAAVSGVVVFEEAEEKPDPSKLSGLYIHAWLEHPDSEFFSGSSISIKPDGSFQISGLRSGVTRLNVVAAGRSGVRRPAVVRIERDGIIQPAGINLKDGEQVTGVRVVLKYLTGVIRGQIKVEGSDLTSASRFSVWLSLIDDGHTGSQRIFHDSQTQVDSRGHFLIEGLAAGTYELNVAVFDAGRIESNQITKQQVTVADNAVSEVTVTVKPKP